MDIGLHSRIAKCAQQDRVEVSTESGKSIRRHRDALLQIAIRAPVELGRVQRRTHRLEDINCLRNDFPTDSISGDDGDFLSRAHGEKVTQNLTPTELD